MTIPTIRLFRALLAGWLFPLGAVLARADSWSGFRGSGGDGIAHSGKPPFEVGVEKNLRWKVPVAAGHSSPVVWGERNGVISR